MPGQRAPHRACFQPGHLLHIHAQLEVHRLAGRRVRDHVAQILAVLHPHRERRDVGAGRIELRADVALASIAADANDRRQLNRADDRGGALAFQLRRALAIVGRDAFLRGRVPPGARHRIAEDAARLCRADRGR